MPRPTHAPALAGLLLAAAILTAACGGESTADSTRPAASDALVAIEAATQAWADWKEGPGRYIDADFFNCYELNGLPVPAVLPSEDPSGHARARRPCDEALRAIERQLDAYARLTEGVRTALQSGRFTSTAELEAILRARIERETWAKDVVAAWKKGDTQTLQQLRQRIQDLSTLEAKAMGLDFGSVTPVPRPTLEYIPGLPTPTPTPTPRR